MPTSHPAHASQAPRRLPTLPALVGALMLLAACAMPAHGPASMTPASIEALLASPDRTAADRSTDERRKPAELLAFTGVGPGMTVLDMSAGGGYTTELMARAVGPQGQVYGQSAPPRAAPMPAGVTPEGGTAPNPAARRIPSPQALAERARRVPNIHAVVRPFEDPAPPELAHGGFDLVTFIYNYHDTGHNGVDRARMNAAVFQALKPGGTYVIVDHAGRPGTGISESGSLHRVEEDFVKREVEAAGFRLVDTASFLRNSADPRDRNMPQPPMPKDGFVLKFVKPAAS